MHWMLKALCAVAMLLPAPARADGDDEDDAASVSPAQITEARRRALQEAEKAVDEAKVVVEQLKRRKDCCATTDPDREE